MNEVHAVIGYLPDETARAASSGKLDAPLEVRLEHGNDDAHVKIMASDVIGVLLGASKKGETSVQVFVNPKAKMDTITRGVASDLFANAIRDFSLFRLRPHLNSIFIDPQIVQKLVDLQRS
jgi:hypothetical protein